jgi:uncharacterized protein
MAPSAREAKRLMRIRLAARPNVIKHTELVTKKALEIGNILRKKGVPVNLELLETGSYLHDIGRSITHGPVHGFVGGQILRELGYPESLINLVERHVGAGITTEEAIKMGLPKRDFLPNTIEEKILAYADKFVESELVFGSENGEETVIRNDIMYDSIEPTLYRFRKIFGDKSPIILRLENLRKEMEELIKL